MLLVNFIYKRLSTRLDEFWPRFYLLEQQLLDIKLQLLQQNKLSLTDSNLQIVSSQLEKNLLFQHVNALRQHYHAAHSAHVRFENAVRKPFGVVQSMVPFTPAFKLRWQLFNATQQVSYLLLDAEHITRVMTKQLYKKFPAKKTQDVVLEKTLVPQPPVKKVNHSPKTQDLPFFRVKKNTPTMQGIQWRSGNEKYYRC